MVLKKGPTIRRGHINQSTYPYVVREVERSALRVLLKFDVLFLTVSPIYNTTGIFDTVNYPCTTRNHLFQLPGRTIPSPGLPTKRCYYGGFRRCLGRYMEKYRHYIREKCIPVEMLTKSRKRNRCRCTFLLPVVASLAKPAE